MNPPRLITTILPALKIGKTTAVFKTSRAFIKKKEENKLEAQIQTLHTHDVVKSFTAEDVVKELEDSDHLDDAIQYFKSQIHKQ